MARPPAKQDIPAGNPNPHEHLGLAMKAAHWMARMRREEPEEWFGAAYTALHDAARTFKPDLGFRFSTLAYQSIRFRLMVESRRRDGGRGMNYDVRLPIQRATANFDPLVTAGRRDAVGRGESAEALEVALSRLTDRERNILMDRARGRSLQEIGDELGVTKECIRQIEVRAIAAARGEERPSSFKRGQRTLSSRCDQRARRRRRGPVRARVGK